MEEVVSEDTRERAAGMMEEVVLDTLVHFCALQEPRELGRGCPLTYPSQSYSTSPFLLFPKASKKVSASGDLETRIRLPSSRDRKPLTFGGLAKKAQPMLHPRRSGADLTLGYPASVKPGIRKRVSPSCGLPVSVSDSLGTPQHSAWG